MHHHWHLYTNDDDWIAAHDIDDLRRILAESEQGYEPDDWECFRRLPDEGNHQVAVEIGHPVPAGAVITPRSTPHPCGGTHDAVAPAWAWASSAALTGSDFTRRLVSSTNF